MQDIIIVGAGQAGLALGAILSKIDSVNFLIVDKNQRIGDSWRSRWDSLTLFSPSEYDALPGLPFPRQKGTYPTKDEMAEYLVTYATHFKLPIRLNTRVTSITKDNHMFQLTTTKRNYQAIQVVIATGAFMTPFVPSFATKADQGIFQIHSSEYQNPDQIPDGTTLIVGTGNSGMQIAQELSESRSLILSGPKPSIIPQRPLGKDLFWYYYTFGLATASKYSVLGRLFYHYEQNYGEAVIGDFHPLLSFKNVIRVPKLTSIQDNKARFENNQTTKIDNIIWCTGYKNDYTWIKLDIFNDQGQPIHYKGVTTIPGLYFLGLNWMSSVNSGQIAGVSKDAKFLAPYILKLSQHR